jgi:hypothetical protein
VEDPASVSDEELSASAYAAYTYAYAAYAYAASAYAAAREAQLACLSDLLLQAEEVRS